MTYFGNWFLVYHYLQVRTNETMKEAAKRVMFESHQSSPSRAVAREILRKSGTEWDRIRSAASKAKPKLVKERQ